MEKEYYYPDLPWSIIKSYNLTLDKTRITKSAKLMKKYCNHYEQLLENDEIVLCLFLFNYEVPFEFRLCYLTREILKLYLSFSDFF